MARKDPLQLRDAAAAAVARGKLDLAIDLYSQLEALEPKAAAWPKRLGETYRRKGDVASAIDAFDRSIAKYTADGLLVQAIAVCKLVLMLAPDNAAIIARLAELAAPTSADAPRSKPPAVASPEPPATAPRAPEPVAPVAGPPVSAARRLAALPEERGVPRSGPPAIAIPPGAALDAIPLAAVMPDSLRLIKADGSASGVCVIPIEEIADAAERVDPARAALSATPVFSQLPGHTIEWMIGRMALLELAPNDVVFEEGAPGTSMFVVADGEVIVTAKGHELARLGAGTFFGEVALITDLPRSATVRAVGSVHVLGIDRELIREASAESPQIISALLGFVRKRLVDRIARTSDLFEPFSDDERHRLAAHFDVIEVDAGTQLIVQGERSDGLYIVMAGKVDVRRDGSTPVHAVLVTGDVFGEMSLLASRGSTANVRALTRVLALRMAASTFREVIMTYPQVLEYLGELSSRRSLLRQAEELIDLHIDMI